MKAAPPTRLGWMGLLSRALGVCVVGLACVYLVLLQGSALPTRTDALPVEKPCRQGGPASAVERFGAEGQFEAGGVADDISIDVNRGVASISDGVATPKSGKFAVFATMTQAKEHYKPQDMMLSALFLKCTAYCHGSQLPFHLIYGGGEMANRTDLEVLKKFGWVIEEHEQDTKLVKQIYKPIYSAEEAQESHRWWGNYPPDVLKVQKRKDGWATYFKFFAWKSVQYDRILMVDLDNLFMESPDPKLDSMPPSVEFMASKERPHGINSHMLVMTPRLELFEELVERASKGEYIPYTQGDQDVLESVYVPRLVTKTRMEQFIKHVHGAQCKPNGRPGWPPSTCSDVLRMCKLPDEHSPKIAAGIRSFQQCISP